MRWSPRSPAPARSARPVQIDDPRPRRGNEREAVLGKNRVHLDLLPGELEGHLGPGRLEPHDAGEASPAALAEAIEREVIRAWRRREAGRSGDGRGMDRGPRADVESLDAIRRRDRQPQDAV